MTSYGLLVDLSKCIGCQSCVVGCKNWHGIPGGQKGRIRLMEISTGEYPEVSRWFFPIMCMHCKYPPCVAVCRYEAGYIRKDGIVTINGKKCVGCELCTFACPYGARVMMKNEHIAGSCDLCMDRIEEGGVPYCVSSCPTEVFLFGDLDDPVSELSRSIKSKNAQSLEKNYGTKPKVYYTNLKDLNHLEWVK